MPSGAPPSLADDVVLPEHLPMSIRNARPALETQTFFSGLSDVIQKWSENTSKPS
jgi:hypothetical protein